MRLDNPSLYDNSLAGILARLTHGILHDAHQRVQEEGAAAVSTGRKLPADASARVRGWLDRLDLWFWKREMKSREAFLAQSIDVFDLERRMRCLERGDTWLGTNGIDVAK